MDVSITRRRETTPQGRCNFNPQTDWIWDHGTFSYYAGPVSINAAGHCINVMASVVVNGVSAVAGTGAASHCG